MRAQRPLWGAEPAAGRPRYREHTAGESPWEPLKDALIYRPDSDTSSVYSGVFTICS